MSNPVSRGNELPLKPLFLFLGGLVGLLVFVLLSMKWFHQAFLSRTLRETPSTTSQSLPPEPRLQTDAAKDLKNFLAKEEMVMTTYGWINEKNGLVRLPIERARALILKEGLPAREKQTEKL